MAKRRSSGKSLKMAMQFRDLLLYEVTGGNLGTKPAVEITSDKATFAEKKGLLSEMIKLAELERRNTAEQEDESPFDAIKRGLNAGQASGSGGNPWGTPKAGDSDPGTDDDEDGLSTEPPEEP